jgi:hypothetical protein
MSSAAAIRTRAVLLLLVAAAALVLLHRVGSCRMECYADQRAPRVALVTFMRGPTELPYWLDHYRALGVVAFFVRLEDSPNWEKYLRQQPDVSLLEVGESDAQSSNYHSLMQRQETFVNKVLKGAARAQRVDWLLHLDQDELLHGSLEVFRRLDDRVKVVHLENVEAVYDRSDNGVTCFKAMRFARCGAGEKCRSYANGKGGGRPVPGVAFAGPHNFSFNAVMRQAPSSYNVPFEDLHVLHFDSCTLGSFVEKFFHISKNVKLEDIPFDAYPRNIEVARQAQAAYVETAAGT